MTQTQMILTVLAVALGTLLTRFLPFLIFPEGKTPPALITRLGNVLPGAVIGLLVVYCLKDGFSGTYHGVPELISLVPVILLHKWRRNTLLSIAAGTVLYMFLVQHIFV